MASAVIEAGCGLEVLLPWGRNVPKTDQRDLVTVHPDTVPDRIAGKIVRFLLCAPDVTTARNALSPT